MAARTYSARRICGERVKRAFQCEARPCLFRHGSKGPRTSAPSTKRSAITSFSRTDMPAPPPLASRPPPDPTSSRTSLPPPASAPPERPGAGYRGWVFLALVLGAFFLYRHYSGEADPQPAIAYTSFYEALSDQKIEAVTLRGQNVLGKFKAPTDIEGQKLTTF